MIDSVVIEPGPARWYGERLCCDQAGVSEEARQLGVWTVRRYVSEELCQLCNSEESRQLYSLSSFSGFLPCVCPTRG